MSTEKFSQNSFSCSKNFLQKFFNFNWNFEDEVDVLMSCKVSPEVNEFIYAKGFMKIKPVILANTWKNQRVSSSVFKVSRIIGSS